MSLSSEKYPGAGRAANGIARLTQDRVKGAWNSGRECARHNPLSMVLGALAIGVLVGLLCGRREPKPRDTRQLAKDFLEDAAGRLTHRLHLDTASHHLRDQWSSLGRKWNGGRFW